MREQVWERPFGKGGPEEPQLPQRSRVEGAGLHTGHAEAAQPGAHLTGGLRRERQSEHLGGTELPGVHPVGDAVRHRPRLSGASTGKDDERAVEVLSDLPLFGVEGSQQLVSYRTRGAGG